jgi:hypothetical protein
LVCEIHKNGLDAIGPLVEASTLLPILWQEGLNFAQSHCFHKPESKLSLKLLDYEEIMLQ